jgi:FKBP-type peptidyl-prolyl cis-trans isomerase (trigger factor)
MMELALSVDYPEIINDHKLDPIGHPRIQITKIAAGNPLEFVLTTATMPAVILGDYKKIAKETSAKKIAEPKVEDKEVADAIEYIKKNDNHDHSHDKGHDHDHAHDHAHPEIDTPEFKDKIKNALIEEKKREAREKKRIEIAENISSASTVDLPNVLIDSEVRRIEAQFKEDITRMGSKIEDYLAQAEKTIEEMRAEWKPHAEKKARLQIILNQIADKEKIVVSDKEIENEVNHILEHYKDADKEKARIYAVGVLTNEKVFEFLEAQKL